MGTTWFRLGYSQEDINARITAIFFSGAFLSFMAVAYIPAYIEDQETFFKERANGLYGPLSFRAMMWNEFHQQTFDCGRFTCSFSVFGWENHLWHIRTYYGYSGGQREDAGYMIAIAMGYRLLAWLALTLRK